MRMLPTMMIGAPVVLFAGLLTCAAAQAPNLDTLDRAPHCADQAVGARPNPTQLDYVVLASFADSTNFLAMSNYAARPAKVE